MNLIKQLSLAIAMLCIAATSSFAAGVFVGDRTDFRDETIYFAMTTRFYDGDVSNNTYCWDGRLNVNDPEWRGDFKGLIDKLDYIKALGFTAVWITPVVENASGLDYHGYHAINFSKVDPRYESTDCTLQSLIDACHARGMKLIVDVVFQHTGNFGEEHLCPMFAKDYSQPLSNINKSMVLHPNTQLPANYFNLPAGQQYSSRLALMKNTDGVNHDTHNYWHHVGNNWDWDDYSRVWGQIAGDCVDLNTENPDVSNYIVQCYTRFIEMGVDAFRIDTGGHIARITFNNNFIPQLHAAAEKYKDKRGGTPFFMYTEVCARARQVIYRGENYNCSPCFYTWKEDKAYPWSYDASSWDNLFIKEGEHGESHPNAASVLQQGKDYAGHSASILAKSNNAWLVGNNYHTPDYSRSSGLSVIDFPMHWNFGNASDAFGVANDDDLYNDATWNVVYVDSHDYGPDGQDKQRFAGSESSLAENWSLMFSFRGIPCVYYGSEIQFRKGEVIDKGADMALIDTGRAYFGGYIKGSANVSDFATYTDATGNMAATLSHPLALHLQRLNLIRAAVPALRKGQYTRTGCSGRLSFKRRYTDANTDSYCLVTISGNATFSGIVNGTYTDVVTGDVKVVTDNTLTATCSGQGNMRCYVLSTALTPAPGKVGNDGRYLYTTSPVTTPQAGYDGTEEEMDMVTVRDTSTGGGGGPAIQEPEQPIEPSMALGEQAAFFENDAKWGGNINAWVWSSGRNYTGGSWPGIACTYLGNNVWKWSYNGQYKIPDDAQIIFNNGASQTDNLKFVNGGYYTSKGYHHTVEGAGEIPDTPQGPEVTWTFYYNDTNFGNTVYAYFWDDATKDNSYLGSWPGTLMSLDPATGYKVVSFKTRDDIAQPMIIFNGGSGKPQTANLQAINGSVYTSASVADIFADDNDTPTYYNLQGISVDPAHLAPGIYIRKQGSRAIRVAIK